MNQPLKLNYMILIKDNKLLPRNQWRKVVVHELVVGSYDQVRGAALCVVSNRKFNYIKRDVQRFIPFDIDVKSLMLNVLFRLKVKKLLSKAIPIPCIKKDLAQL